MNPNEKSGGRQLGVLDLAHHWLREHVSPGDLCIDATCGRGNDTRLLCELTGAEGRVIGFDIQQSWESVGILPIEAATEENPNGHTVKLQVKINK